MQGYQEYTVELTLYLLQKSTAFKQLSLLFEQNKLLFKFQKSSICLPIQNISTIAKNQHSLILMLHDPSRESVQEVWEEELQQEENQKVKPHELDQLLFEMLSNIHQGKTFNNVLKGDFQLHIVFPSLSSLTVIKNLIQEGLQKIQEQLQYSNLQMELEQQEGGNAIEE